MPHVKHGGKNSGPTQGSASVGGAQPTGGAEPV